MINEVWYIDWENKIHSCPKEYGESICNELYLTKLEAARTLLETTINYLEDNLEQLDYCFKIIKEEQPPLNKRQLVYKFMELPYVKKEELMGTYINLDYTQKEQDWTKCFKIIEINGWLEDFELELESMINES